MDLAIGINSHAAVIHDYEDMALIFDVVARPINTQVAVVDVKLQDPVMQERPYPQSYIDAVIPVPILRCDQLSTLRCRAPPFVRLTRLQA